MRVSKYLLQTSAFLTLMSVSASALADTLFGVYAGAGGWHQDPDGHFTASGSEVDTKEDLSLGDGNDNMFWLAFEHPLPFVPNVRVQQTKTDLNGGTDLVRAVTLDNVTFAPPGIVETGFEFKVADAILYYNVIDGETLSLDAGIAARRIDGSAFINSGVRFAEIEFDGSVPMLYARGEWRVLSGFWFGAGGQYVEYKGDSYIDVDGAFGWQSEWGVGAEVGYRYMRMKVEDLGDIDSARLIVDGPYAALNYKF